MNELCEYGQDLWDNFRYYSIFSSVDTDKIYKKYVDHIIECSECQKKLGLTEHDIEILKEFT